MPDPDPTTASSAGDHTPSRESTVDSGNPDLSPLDGGRWRPVSPGELLRKNVADSNEELDDDQREQRRTVQLERRQELEHKLKANPTDVDGFLELAGIYRSEHRPLEAKRLLQQATQIFPDDERVLFQLEEATLARSLQQYREVSDLASRLKTPEADRELERSRGDWAMRRIEVCRARLARDPSQIQLRLAMADAKFDAELFEESFADAGHLLELDEFSPQAHFLRARCLLALGKDLPAMKELCAWRCDGPLSRRESLRHASLKLLCDLADKLSLQATGQQYHSHLKRLQATSSPSKS